MDRLRDDLQEAEQKLARLSALPKVERQLAREADRLAKLAADFPARANELSEQLVRQTPRSTHQREIPTSGV